MHAFLFMQGADKSMFYLRVTQIPTQTHIYLDGIDNICRDSLVRNAIV